MSFSTSPISSTTSSTSFPPVLRNLDRLRQLEKNFNEKIIGQEIAIYDICESLKCILGGFYDEEVPYGVYLFAGTTGVGKTELAKIIAEELDVPFIRYNMSEFAEDHTRSSLLGSPPGYVGSETEGRLISDLKKNPVSVILFDEIEKAHPEILTTFLQLFEGHITDRTGHYVSSKNIFFIMTSNLGSSLILENSHSKKPLSSSALHQQLQPIFIQKFSTEFYNRIHKTIVFKMLSNETICKIVNVYMKSLAEGIFNRKALTVQWTEETTNYFATLKINLEMGARGIHRRIRAYIYPLLANFNIHDPFSEGDTVEVYPEGTILKCKKIVQIHPTIALGSRVIRLWATKQPLEKFIGKYAIRSAPCKLDLSFMTTPVKIVYINEKGIGIKNNRSPQQLGHFWNDNQWILPHPNKSTRHFLLNLCLEIPEKDQRVYVLKRIKQLFNSKDGLSNSLKIDGDFWTELTNHATQKNEDLVETVNQLKESLKSVTIEWSSPETTVKMHSTEHYDFYLHDEQPSKKRKQIV